MSHIDCLNILSEINDNIKHKGELSYSVLLKLMLNIKLISAALWIEKGQIMILWNCVETECFDLADPDSINNVIDKINNTIHMIKTVYVVFQNTNYYAVGQTS